MSDMARLCLSDYQEYLALREMNQDLKRALKSHERVPLFIDSLAKELYQLPFEVSRATVKQAVYDLTEVFIKCVEMKANESHYSQAKKDLIQANSLKEKQMQELADAITNGGQTNVESKDQLETYRTTIKI